RLGWCSGFFFQAEDGIRDLTVTGVQTCALPISSAVPKPDAEIGTALAPLREATLGGARESLWVLFGSVSLLLLIACTNVAALLRSEERRVGKEGRSRSGPYH